jgi:ribonucleotide monophosphatase NagD (HAD superfamily)
MTTTSLASQPPRTPLPLASVDQDHGVQTVLLTGGTQRERDQLAARLLEQGTAVCSVSSLALAHEAMNAYAQATGAPFDVFFAFCGDDLAVEDVLDRSAMAIEVVAVRDETWTVDELDNAIRLGNVLLLDDLPT